MKSPDHELGYRLKAAREDRRLTQERLAEMVGIATSYLSEIENKRTIPSFTVLSSLCKTLNVSLDDLIFHTESDQIQSVTRLLSQCNDRQLRVIKAMIEAMLQADCDV